MLVLMANFLDFDHDSCISFQESIWMAHARPLASMPKSLKKTLLGILKCCPRPGMMAIIEDIGTDSPFVSEGHCRALDLLCDFK